MAFLKQSDLILEYIAGELLALAKHEGIPVIKVTIQPPRPNDKIFPTDYYRYQFWLDDKFVCSNYYYKKLNRWNTGTRSPCKENKDLVAMMEKYFPDGIVDKDTVKKLPTSSIKNFSEAAISKLNDSPRPFFKELLKLMGENILSQQSIVNEIFNLNKIGWDLINKVSKDKVPTPIDPFYKDLGLTELITVPTSNVCWNSLIRYNDNNLVIEAKDGNIYIYKRRSNINNFSKRIKRCFSIVEPYTQTYEVSVQVDLSDHPDWDIKESHPADECLPDSLKTDLESIGVKCKKSGFMDVNNKDKGYTILQFDIEREPKDRYEEVTNFVTNKLVEAGFDKNKISITKWD